MGLWLEVLSMAGIYKLPSMLTAQPEGGYTVTSPALTEFDHRRGYR